VKVLKLKDARPRGQAADGNASAPAIGNHTFKIGWLCRTTLAWRQFWVGALLSGISTTKSTLNAEFSNPSFVPG